MRDWEIKPATGNSYCRACTTRKPIPQGEPILRLQSGVTYLIYCRKHTLELLRFLQGEPHNP